jgi:hypothetical protein
MNTEFEVIPLLNIRSVDFLQIGTPFNIVGSISYGNLIANISTIYVVTNSSIVRKGMINGFP